jgi:hypothetical protein
MAQINGDTVIQMTVKQILASGLVIVGALWGVSQLTFGGLKADVADIRSAVTDAQNRNANTQQTSTATDSQLRSEIAGLTAELRVTNAGLASLTSSVAGLNESVKTVDDRLATSVSRQENFERWVVTRLGQDAATPAVIPIEWQKFQGEVLDSLKTGSEPLTGWYKAISEQR